MDEVDGMAGNEDRGGVAAIIQLIRASRVPVICMCNDRHHPKIRSLSQYCFDLRINKPRLEQIRVGAGGVGREEGTVAKGKRSCEESWGEGLVRRRGRAMLYHCFCYGFHISLKAFMGVKMAKKKSA